MSKMRAKEVNRKAEVENRKLIEDETNPVKRY